MALTTMKALLTPIEQATRLDNNFAYLDQAKADAADLGNYVQTSLLGAPGGVATLDSGGKVVETANSATTATNFASSGGIKDALDGITTEITNIKNGNTPVGKAAAVDPPTSPGNDMMLGTTSTGTIAWLPIPVPAEGTPGPAGEPFTVGDSRWDAGSGGIYSLTFAHSNKYPSVVFKDQGSGLYTQVMVDTQRDNTNIIIRAFEKFGGYVVVQ